MLIIVYEQVCVCGIAPFPIHPNPAENYNLMRVRDISADSAAKTSCSTTV